MFKKAIATSSFMVLPRLETLARRLADNVNGEESRETILEQAHALQAYAAFRIPAHPDGRLRKAKQILFPRLGVPANYSASIPSLCDGVLWFNDWGVTDISGVAKRSSRVLSLDSDSILQPRAEYFEQLKVPDMTEFLTRCPFMLEYDKKTIRRGARFFRSIHVRKIGEVLMRVPRVFTYSAEGNLRPTYGFLRDTFGITARDIIQTPSLLMYSLDNRIKPRCAYLEELGRLGNYAAGSVLWCTDEVFARKMAKQPLSKYRAFQHRRVQQLLEESFGL